MSRLERGIAALLLAVAVAGGALMPRLLSEPSGPRGVALGPGPSRSIVRVPAAPKPRHVPAPAVVHPVVVQPALPAATPVQRVAASPATRPKPRPAVLPVKHATAPPPAPQQPLPAGGGASTPAV